MKPNSTQPFFSLLTYKDTSYRPYSPGFFEKLYANMHLLRAKHDLSFAWLKAAHIVVMALIPALGIAAMGVSFLSSGMAFWLPLVGGALTTVLGTVLGIKQHQWLVATGEQQRFIERTKDLTPPDLEHPWIKTQYLTFNQLTSFYCDDNHQLWYALRESTLTKPQWKPLYFPQLPQDQKSEFDLKADGQNLMVKVTRDHQAQVYYKKVFEDKRTDNGYEINDLCESPKAEKQWFSLPVISWLFVGQWGKKLSLDPAHAWTMTHAGDLKHQMNDARGRSFEIWGVTSVFEHTEQGLKIYDPYVPRGVEITVSLPPEFCVQEIKGTSSHLFLLGYDRTDPDMTPRLLERILDYDALGLNPLIGYTKDTQGKGRLMPLSEWHRVSLPRKNYDWFMTVIHPGKGFNPEVRLQARNQDKGEKGFYFKRLGHKHWHYKKVEQRLERFTGNDLRPIPRHSFKLANACIHGQRFKSGKIEHYDMNKMQVPLKLTTEDGSRVLCYLYRDTNLILDTLHGKNHFSWVLALAPKSQTKENRAWFNGAKGTKVTVEEQGAQLVISGPDIELTFNQTKSLFKGWSYPRYPHSESHNTTAVDLAPTVTQETTPSNEHKRVA